MLRSRPGILGLTALLASACGVAYSPIVGSSGGVAGGATTSGSAGSSGTSGSVSGTSTSGTSGSVGTATGTGTGTGSSGTTSSGSGTTSSGTTSSGTSTGSSTTSGTTTGPSCTPTLPPIEQAFCQQDQDCGCPMGCDLGATPSYCKFICRTTQDCANSGEFCFVDGGSTTYCDVNYCNTLWAACNASANGDGTCTPQPYSTAGVCFQAGNVALGGSCDFSYSRVDAGPLCAPGLFCLPGSADAGACVTGCDPTVNGSCQQGETCAALVGTPSHPTSPHEGYCVATAGNSDAGALLLPQVPNNGGFGTLAMPNLVTISFENYTYPTDSGVKAYGDFLLASQWLSTVGADYGVSNGGTHLADLIIQGVAPNSVNDSDIQDTIATWIADGGVPAPDKNTIYLIFYPDTTTISAIGSTSCQSGGFGGYHQMFDGGSGPVIYGVIASCPNTNGIGPSESDGVSLAASHEFMEAATDPDSNSQNGADRTWAFSDFTQPWAWSFGEVADPCTGAPSTETTAAGTTFVVQRVWSNTAARNGFESPCIPIPPNDVYFTVYTNPVDTQVISSNANDQTVTYTLIPWANGPVSGGWNLFAGAVIYDSVNGLSNGTVTFSQADGGSGTSMSGVYVGAPLTMSVDVPAGTNSQSLIQVQLYSYTDNTFTHYNIWPAAIIVQ